MLMTIRACWESWFHVMFVAHRPYVFFGNDMPLCWTWFTFIMTWQRYIDINR